MIEVTFIRQGSTPALEITAIGEVLDGMTVYVVLDQDDRQIVKTNKHEDPSVSIETVGNDTKITAVLSQADTLWLRPGAGRVQLRWVDEDGTAGTSDCGYVEVGESLMKGVITYG